MRNSYLTWDEAADLFERRGLPKETYQNLYEHADPAHDLRRYAIRAARPLIRPRPPRSCRPPGRDRCVKGQRS